MDFVKSYYFPNATLTSWTFLDHFCHHFWVGLLLLWCCTHPKVMTKMAKKCSTDQRFIHYCNERSEKAGIYHWFLKRFLFFCLFRFANTPQQLQHPRWTNWVKKSLRIWSNMLPTLLTGTPGANKPLQQPGKATSWFFFRLVIPLVTGVMLWKGSLSKTQR